MTNSGIRVTVATVAHCEGRFLMIEEIVRGRRVMTQPSGRLEAGETLLEAVTRETLEESGHAFDAIAVGGVYFWRDPQRDAPLMRVNVIGHATALPEPVGLDDGIQRVAWLTRDEMLGSTVPHRSPLVLRTVDDFLAGKTHPPALLQNLHTML